MSFVKILDNKNYKDTNEVRAYICDLLTNIVTQNYDIPNKGKESLSVQAVVFIDRNTRESNYANLNLKVMGCQKKKK